MSNAQKPKCSKYFQQYLKRYASLKMPSKAERMRRRREAKK